MKFNLIATLVCGAMFAAVGQVAFKLGATGRESLAAFVNGWILFGLLSYAVGTGLWIFALSKAPLTLVYPFTALTFVVVYAAGVLFFGDATSPRQLAGVGLILVGLYLITAR